MKTNLLKKTTSLLLLLIAFAFTSSGQNLLTQDPSFEDVGTGTALSWKWYTGGTAGTTSRETSSPKDGLAYAKAVTTTAGNYWDFGISNYQSLTATLIAGETYTISFYYKNSAGHSFRVGVQDNNGAAPYDFFKIISTEASTWTLGTYEFTVSPALVGGTNDVRIKFDFGKDLGTTEIDNVQLKSAVPPAPSANLVLNPSFETDNGSGLFLNWFAQAAAGSSIVAATTTPQAGSRYLRADVTTAGNPWDVQASSDNFTVVPGHQYAVSFWYKSNKKIRLVLQGSSYYNQTDVPASSTPATWVKFATTVTYASTQTDVAISLKFHLNIDNGFAEIDNVSVSDLSQLPVILTSYTAKPTLSSVVLNWSTSSENNADYYQILRAGDDKIFTALSTASAKNKAANYAFTDNTPLKGNNYYQLLQYDKDGKVNDLGTKAANFSIKLGDELAIYPNPVTDKFSFNLSDYTGKTIKVVIVDVYGRMVVNKTIDHQSGINSIKLPLGLSSGVYTLNITGDLLNKTTRLLVK